MNLKKNLKTILFLGIIIKVLGLLYRIITTRVLGLEGMRLVSLITPSISLCICLSSFSIQPVCNQNIASNIKDGKVKVSVILVSCLKITLITSSIVSILMMLSFPIYKNIFQNSFIYYPLLASIPLIYISNFSGIIKGYLEANNIFKTTYLANVFESLAKILFSMIFLIIFKNHSINIQVLTIFISLSLSEVVSSVILTNKIKKHVNRPIFKVDTQGYESQIFKEALPLTLEGLVSTIASYIMPFIFYFAALKVGVDFHTSTTYYALVTSYSIPLLISGQFAILTVAKLIFPSVSKNIGNQSNINNLFNKTLIISLFLSIVCFNFCYFYADIGLDILFGNSTGKDIVIFMAPLFFFIYFDPIFVVILQAYKKGKILFSVTLLSQIISILLIYFLTTNPNIKLMGYTYAITIGLLIKFILLFISSLIVSKYKPKIYDFISYILLSIIYLLLNSLFTHFLNLIISTIAFSLLYLLLLKTSHNKK
jgi:stage V sporulation protein B